MVTLLAALIRPYWSTVNWDTAAPLPYTPGVTPVGTRSEFEMGPTRFAEFRLEIP